MPPTSQLASFFHPKSIAVIGASNHHGKVGFDVMQNLLNNFAGEIYPINPGEKNIQGRKAYVSVSQLPQAPDLAIIVIPASLVPGVVAQCGQKGCRDIIIISAGFKEAGASGAKLENKLAESKQKFNLRILGPNCLGYISASPAVNASFARSFPAKGKIAFVSQSGALGTAVLDMAQAQQVGLSYFVSMGNKVGLNELDFLKYLKNHTSTKAILLYLESIIDGRKFMEVAGEVSQKKPIIVLKSGKTEKGQKAVSSHTGSLAGSAQAYSTAFSQSGIIEAEDLEDFFNYAEGFAYQPLPEGDRVAIVTNAGGPGILVTDLLPKFGLQLAELSSATKEKLKKKLPPAASSHNPIDVLGDAKADRYALALELTFKDKGVDSVIVVLTPQKMTEIKATAEAIGRLSRRYKKTVILCFLGEAEIVKHYATFKKYSLPQFSFPLQAVKVLGQMWQYQQFKLLPKVDQSTSKQKLNHGLLRINKRIFSRAIITEEKSRELLFQFDFPLHCAELVKNPAAAIAAAQKIGYPIALKIVSEQVLHKSDVGGVAINIKNDEALRQAVIDMKQKISKKFPRAKINGFLVGEMVKGFELIVGFKRDEQFGPLIMVGAGGIYAEVFGDVAFGIAPLSLTVARQMLEKLQVYKILAGTRGQKALDTEAVVKILLKLSELALAWPQIKEVDFNPVMVGPKGQGAVIVDIRIMT
jgi:acetyltransferase